MQYNLSLVIQWIDNATQALKQVEWNIQGFAQRNQANFKKMATVWGIAFWAITAWIGKATQAAAKSEGTWNKFNTVFAEWSDEMKEFVEDIRTRMPVATDTIARMAADVQDLLVPMWLSRELWAEMTQGFLEVANAIGAFDDVDPSEVLEAIKSWMTGASKALQRFSVDASIPALEARAVSEWLLKAWESFNNLDYEVRNQIKAQALLAQIYDNSSDAINWFAENSDSLIFRNLELKATIQDMIGVIGRWFLPIVDDIVKKIQPVVEQVVDRTEENQPLTRNIILASLAVAWLVTALWILWLILPKIVVAVTLLFSPIGILIALLAWLAVYVVRHRTEIRDFWLWVVDSIVEFSKRAWDQIGDTVITTLRVIVAIVTWWLSEVVLLVVNNRELVKETTAEARWRVQDNIFGVVDNIVWYVTRQFDRVKNAIGGIRDFGNNAISSVWGAITSVLPWRHTGWAVRAWQSYIVWEKWPEVFTPRSSGNIIANWWWWWVNVNINWVNINNGKDEVRFKNMLEDVIIKAQRWQALWFM